MNKDFNTFLEGILAVSAPEFTPLEQRAAAMMHLNGSLYCNHSRTNPGCVQQQVTMALHLMKMVNDKPDELNAIFEGCRDLFAQHTPFLNLP